MMSRPDKRNKYSDENKRYDGWGFRTSPNQERGGVMDKGKDVRKDIQKKPS
jgi:hypothetical protein